MYLLLAETWYFYWGPECGRKRYLGIEGKFVNLPSGRRAVGVFGKVCNQPEWIVFVFIFNFVFYIYVLLLFYISHFMFWILFYICKCIMLLVLFVLYFVFAFCILCLYFAIEEEQWALVERSVIDRNGNKWSEEQRQSKNSGNSGRISRRGDL